MADQPNPYEENWEEDASLPQLAQRFEQACAQGACDSYFDGADLENLFHYYLDDQHDLDLAHQVLEVGQAQHPQNDLFFALQADIELSLRHNDQAFRILDTYPHDQEPWWLWIRFRTLVRLRRTEEAEEVGNKLLSMTRCVDQGAMRLATVFLQVGRMDLTRKFLRIGVQANDQNAALLNFLAVVEDDMENYVAAKEWVNKAVQIDPYDKESWLHKAIICLHTDDLEACLEALEYVLAIDPMSWRGHLFKARCLILMERPEHAQEWVKKMLSLFPEQKGQCLTLQADIAFQQDDFKRAATLYNKVLKNSDVEYEVALRFAQCKVRLHRWKEALCVLEGLYRYVKDDARIASELGEVYRSTGQYDKSLKMFRRCIQLEPQEVMHYVRFVLVALCQKDIQSASRMVNRALKVDPDDMWVNIVAAFVAYIKANYKALLRYYQHACQVDNRAPEIFQSLCPEGAEYIARQNEENANNDANAPKD